MNSALLIVMLLAQSDGTWHDRFIEGNCEACPECCVSEDDCEMAVPVRAFEPSPCTGVLWPASHTAKALEIIKVDFPKCEVRLDSTMHELKICDETIIMVRQECDKTIDRFAALTKEAAHIERPWWDNNTLWGGAGFVVGAVVTVFIINATGDSF